MTALKRTILQSFAKLPKTLLRKFVIRKLTETGTEMLLEVVDAFTDHLLSGQRSVFFWQDGTEGELKELRLVFTEEDGRELDAAITKALEIVPEAVQNATAQAAKLMFRALCERWTIEGIAQHSDAEGFRDRMQERWGEGLGYLRMLLTCCREAGQEALTRYNKSKSNKYTFRRWVSVRLHARACQVSDEIICLMENGFADGAMARWRTLHELSVVAAMITNGDEDLAERYILHDAVEVKRQADEYDATQLLLGNTPIKKRQRAAIERRYQTVMDRFGPAFTHPYGWAAKHLNHKKPTFKEVQVAAGSSGMNSYYKLASFNVHAGARSLFFNLSSIGIQDVILAGKSNAGLAEPGDRLAQTLLLITSLCIGISSNFDRIAELNCLIHIRDAAGLALRRAERRLVRQERARQKLAAEQQVKRNSMSK